MGLISISNIVPVPMIMNDFTTLPALRSAELERFELKVNRFSRTGNKTQRS